MDSQTSPGMAFLSKDPAVGKQCDAGLQCLGFLASRGSTHGSAACTVTLKGSLCGDDPHQPLHRDVLSP